MYSGVYEMPFSLFGVCVGYIHTPPPLRFCSLGSTLPPLTMKKQNIERNNIFGLESTYKELKPESGINGREST